MTKRSRVFLFIVVLAGALAASGPGQAQGGVRVRAIDPKPFYRPGDTIVLELRCDPGVPDVMVDYNPTLQDDDWIALEGDPRCPFARFEIQIPRDFIGKNRVFVRRRPVFTKTESREKLEDRDPPHVPAFAFEVRSNVQPSDLWFSTDTQNEGCNYFYLREGTGPQNIGLFSVVPDGTRFDLCREGKATIRAVPKDHGVIAMKDGACTLLLKKQGDLKIVASYRGLRKEWPCTEGGPKDAPRPRN